MNNIARACLLGGLLGSALLATAGPLDKEPRAIVNLGFSFGDSLPSDFHYGLRFDYDSVGGHHAYAPAVLGLDFSSASGLQRFLIGGVDFSHIPYMLNQLETAAAAGGGIGAGTIAATVVGVAAAAVVVNNASDDDDAPVGSTAGGSTTGGSTTGGSTTGGSTTGGSTTGGSTTGGSTTGGSTTGGSTTGGSTTGGSTTGGSTTGSTTGGTTGGPTGGITGGILGGITGAPGFSGRDSSAQHGSSEYQDWLDGGTGHMGDLNH
jgi:hypothetical protein